MKKLIQLIAALLIMALLMAACATMTTERNDGEDSPPKAAIAIKGQYRMH